MRRDVSDPAPFFVVGCGRSGTTLVRAVLDSHPDVAVPLESYFIADYLRSEPKSLAHACRLMTKEFELREWGVDVEPQELQQSGSVVSAIRLLHERYAAHHGARIWGQKTPRLVLHWREISDAFPDARFIHVIRDPRAVAASMVRSNVHKSTPLHAARRWRRDVSHGLELEQALGTNCLRVTYEDFVQNPEDSARTMAKFIGVEYSPQMLAFHEQAADDYGSYYSQIHAHIAEPIRSDRTEAWTRELSTNALRVVETFCGDLMNEVSYQRHTQTGPRRGTVAMMELWRAGRTLPRLWHFERHRQGFLYSYARRKLMLRLFEFFR